MARRRRSITRQERKSQTRVGLRGRATSAESLGPKDPRWRRNANINATSKEYGQGLDLVDGVLEVEPSSLKGVAKSAQSPLSLDDRGSVSLPLGNALEVVKGELAVAKMPASTDSVAASLQDLVGDFNALLEQLRTAGFKKR